MGRGRGMFEVMGARVGGRGARVDGRGAVEEERVDGRGGGSMKDGLEERGRGGGGMEEGLGGAGVLSSSESVNVGMASSRVVADAFGVVSGESRVDGGFAIRGGGGGIRPFVLLPTSLPFSSVPTPGFFSWSFILESFFSSVVCPFFTAGRTEGGPSRGVWRHKPRKYGSHCSRRNQRRPTEATIKDMPSAPMAPVVEVATKLGA